MIGILIFGVWFGLWFGRRINASAPFTLVYDTIPYAKTPTVGIADEAALYAMDNDSVFFKPCTGKRNYIGKYDKKTNSILLK